MMAKLLRTAIAAWVLSALFAVSVASAAPMEPAKMDDGKSAVQLTEAQKREIAALYGEILEKKKAVIAKYVEYGVIGKEKGEHIKDRMQRHYDMLEQNGYLPNWKKCRERHKRHKSE